LGCCYRNGEGVEQDNEKAVEWFLKAAEQGNAEAQFALGVCYHNGEGVKQDYEQTIKWLQKAAEQGHKDAFHALHVARIERDMFKK